ncbi:type VI secretion system Vgr family protein [Intestinirhabdus alba]|jgi:type VI secretion system secreted protein VgrG|uniref:Type VI secretion system tip protein VgrG n=1 Tax=Intestinirhabdus alba TaxID=2899544 RepID=A0A6L6IQM9_9ENTR|nr:type VI secretion system tip protein VgrG [Intestinirhabdus alba]MTH48264.1 type VI secretion system tip protein VgrG [Intestinirhabdus alba]
MSEVQSLIFSHSHYLLSVHGCPAPLDVLCFDGHEALSEPFSYAIEFTSADKSLSPQQMLLRSASLTLQAPPVQGHRLQQPVRTIQGVVTGFEHLSTSKDETRYSLTLQPRLALLARSRQNRIYQDMSVPQIVEHILRTRHAMRGQDFVFTLANEYPRREQVMQYGEDDLTFISRLLAGVGIWFRFTTDARLKIDVVTFSDAQRHYEQGLILPLASPSGQSDTGRESVWALESRHRVVEKSVFTRGYNYRNAPEEMSLSIDATRGGDTTTYGEAYHWAENYLRPGKGERHDPKPESGAFYARLRHERYLNSQTSLSGITNCAALTPGQVLKVNGAQAVTEASFHQGVAIVSIHSSARRDRSFMVAFRAIPATKEYSFRPAPVARPTMAGTLPARIASTTKNDIYGHIDRDGRYKVNFLFDRDSWPAGEESMWVRQARPYAGDTYGLHLPLLAGTEVAIAFEQGDPDRPYISGVLHDSAHPDHVTIGNYRRNVLRTPANNKLRLDDTRGKEHIKISTEYGGKSQLNLGHLVDGKKERRGEGFELRSDSRGAIRAGKGLFISADGQPKAQGAVLEMQPALGNLEAARKQMHDISADAKTAGADPADLQAQVNWLEQQVRELEEAVILLSAPRGIALSSGAHLQASAAENLIVTAGNNADISVVKNLFIGVGNALSMFVKKAGIKLIANQGAVQVQAQNDRLQLKARGGVAITSTEDEINIIARKKITINGGGSYIELDANKIESGTLGEYLTKAGYYGRRERASQQHEMMVFPLIETGDYHLQFRFTDDDGVPYSSTPYIAYFTDGSQKEGMTDGDGNTENFRREREEDIIIHLVID